MAFSQTMYIEIKEDVIRDAIRKKELEINDSLDLLLLMALCAKQGKHIVSVPCLLTNTDLCKELTAMMGKGNFGALYRYNSYRYKYNTVIAQLSIKCVISYEPKADDEGGIIWVIPYKNSEFEPWVETYVLTENLADSTFFTYLAYYYANNYILRGNAKNSDIAFNFYPLMGGGVTIDKVLQMEIKRKQHFCLTIADSDKKWNDDTTFGETAQNMMNSIETFNPFNCRLYVMNKVREIENLIPRKLVEQFGDKNGFWEIFKYDSSFFDMKIGLCLSELWHREVYKYWKEMLGDTSIFTEYNSIWQRCQNKKNYDQEIKGKEPIKKGFGKNLLSLTIGDINYVKEIKKYNPKMIDSLYSITPHELTPAQQEEWKNIGQLMFSWTCCLKCRI